ncbi:hypothetical protein AMTR_s00001p00272490 [Amborella trichopoda]|uniref:Uncharacterized protein n=1 Tax=Amborella trichopoda TaxID=13333 RepID=W1NME7_AMBTC|nr:hypothetical protein AMTR_s00001p00272490 [Amborella trichopoda]
MLEPIASQYSSTRRVTFHHASIGVDRTIVQEAVHEAEAHITKAEGLCMVVGFAQTAEATATTPMDIPQDGSVPPIKVGPDMTEADVRSKDMIGLLRSNGMPALSSIHASFSFLHGASTDDIIMRGDDTCSEEIITVEHLTYFGSDIEVTFPIEVKPATVTPNRLWS